MGILLTVLAPKMDTYLLMAILSGVVILSYAFNVITAKTKVPSVLMLIGFGMLVNLFAGKLGFPDMSLYLEFLGSIGLIMIVLEGALDLHLTPEKVPIVIKSLLVALVSLVLTTALITGIFMLFYQNMHWVSAILYAMPLSILSSAIVIPSISHLKKHDKEFLIYDSTFSDILGIMFFYAIKDNADVGSVMMFSGKLIFNFLLTTVISVALSYVTIYLIQYIKTGARLILLLSVITLMYTFMKLEHLSALLIILIFGLMVSNPELLIFRWLREHISVSFIKKLFRDLNMLTIEVSFLIRTFFFIIFGMSISLGSFLNIYVWVISAVVLLVIYVVRFGSMKIVRFGKLSPSVYVAPRGLITVLLFYSIPEKYQISDFHTGVLFMIILVTVIVMGAGLHVHYKRVSQKEPKDSSEEKSEHHPEEEVLNV
ncbi:MAG: cation:proton antiporter [Bacteroidales bacterium]